MATIDAYFNKIYFVFEPELTQVFVLVSIPNEPTLGGWRHKTFPATMPAGDILSSFVEDSPLMWDSGAPI